MEVEIDVEGNVSEGRGWENGYDEGASRGRDVGGGSGARRGSCGALFGHTNAKKMACARQQTEGRKRGGSGGNRGGDDRSRRGKRPAACDNGKGDGKVSEGGIGAGVAGAPSNKVQ